MWQNQELRLNPKLKLSRKPKRMLRDIKGLSRMLTQRLRKSITGARTGAGAGAGATTPQWTASAGYPGGWDDATPPMPVLLTWPDASLFGHYEVINAHAARPKIGRAQWGWARGLLHLHLASTSLVVQPVFLAHVKMLVIKQGKEGKKKLNNDDVDNFWA